MIRLTNDEKEYLVSRGMWYGENGISRTYAHKPNYYLCESYKNIKLLADYYEQVGKDPADLFKKCVIRKGR